MKAKPNTDQFKKDPTEFLTGGAADAAENRGLSNETEGRVYREQKMFRLPLDVIARLKREAYERSVNAGTRVTETEIVEQALRSYFKI